MSPAAEPARKTSFGIAALTSVLLQAGAVTGLAQLGSQIEIFGFGDEPGPNARAFPLVALGLLALSVLCRLITNRHRPDQPIGPAADIAKTLAVALAVAVALALMPVAGFLASAAVIGVVVAAAFGERRILSGFVVTLAIAALVTAGARYGLKIPLP